MRISTDKLIEELIALTTAHIKKTSELKSLDDAVLNKKHNPDSWSALECIEHLNRYAEFYIPEMKGRIVQSNIRSVDTFKAGTLGNYFANSMKPKEKLKKMKTFKVMNPVGSKLDKNVLDRFIQFESELLNLLEQAKKVNLNKVRTSISISKMIKLKLGDTFRFYIYHIDRHLQQANRALK